MKNHLQKTKQGFTIIEVMIVLAIAGLIMVIVFLAVPQLQRSQRNSHRKSIVNRVSAELDNYSSNNNGAIPNSGVSIGAFITRYLSNTDINDPTTGNPMMTGAGNYAAIANVPALGVIDYRDGAICNGEIPTAAGANARNYAIWIIQEGGGGAGYCVDNH